MASINTRKIPLQANFQANSTQTRSATTISLNKDLVSKVSQKEDDSKKGTEIETKPAEEINGIKIYETSSGLKHLNKQDPKRIAFKQNVKEMNKLLKEVQAEINRMGFLKESSLCQKILELQEISDSSYMPDTTAFEFCEYMKILQPQLEGLNDYFKNFSIDKLQQKVEFNETYKNGRMEAKKEIISRNEKSFGDKYTDSKYKEKAEDSSYTFMADGFYAKEKDVNGIKKRFLRRKYSSAQEQVAQLNDGQARVTQAKESLVNGGRLEEYSELTSKLVNLQKIEEFVNQCSTMPTVETDIIDRISKHFNVDENLMEGCTTIPQLEQKIKESEGTEEYQSLLEVGQAAVTEYNNVVKEFLTRAGFGDTAKLMEAAARKKSPKGLKSEITVSSYLKATVKKLLQNSYDQYKFLLDDIKKTQQSRIDLVTDESKRNNGPGLERQDLNLSKLETRSKDADGKAIIDVQGKGKAKLDVSIATLHSLFPFDDKKTMSPIQQTGDCYLIDIFTQFMKDPEKRVDIYKCFTTSEDGKTVTVKYPGGKMSLTYNLDESGEIKDFKKSKKGVDGSVGFQLLEELQACERVLLYCKTEEQKEEAMSILQSTDRSIDERLEEIYKKGIEKDSEFKSEGQAAFSYFIDGGNVKDISELMGYEFERESTSLEFVIGMKKNESLLGRLWDGHAQAIVDSRHYGVNVEEPNSSNRQGFVSFDNVVSEVPPFYYYQLVNKYGEDKLAQLRNNMDPESILKELQDFEEPIKSMIEHKDKQLEEKLAQYEENLSEQLEEKNKSLDEITGKMEKLEKMKAEIDNMADGEQKDELLLQYEAEEIELNVEYDYLPFVESRLEESYKKQSSLIRDQKKLELVKVYMDFVKLGENVEEGDQEKMQKLADDLGCKGDNDIAEILKDILLPTPSKNPKTLAGMGLDISEGVYYKRTGASNFE